MDIGIPMFLLIETFLTVKFSISNCKGAVSRDCPEEVCKSGNCTVVGKKYQCGCYNIGSGEHCDPHTDGHACEVLQCVDGLCKVSEENVFFCECIEGWEAKNCNKRKPNYHITRVSRPEDTRSQWPVYEKDVKSRGQVRDYTGIAVMVGIIGFLSVFSFVFTKLLRSSQREHFLIGAGLRNYLGGLHASRLRDESISRGRALRAAQTTRYSGNLLGCTCTLDAGPQCSCPSSSGGHRLRLEASIHLTHICVEDSISNQSETSQSLIYDPPPVYADIVSERVTFINGGSETPPPAYEDLVF